MPVWRQEVRSVVGRQEVWGAMKGVGTTQGSAAFKAEGTPGTMEIPNGLLYLQMQFNQKSY